MLRLFVSYFAWHYTRGIADLFRVMGNFLWFLYHLFSIPVLAKTLFSPWRREGEAYKGGFHVEAFFETFVVNTIMRVVGFLVRGSVIIFGLGVLIIALVIAIAVLISWIVLPAAIAMLIISGLRLMIK